MSVRCSLSALVLVAAMSSSAAADGSRVRNFVVPSGELGARGDLTITQHAVMAYYSFNYGLGDRIDLDAGFTPGPFAGHAQVRVGLTPRDSKLRVTAGAVVGAVGLSVGVVAPGVTASVGYRGADLDLHFGTTVLNAGDKGMVTVNNAGFHYQVHDWFALNGEAIGIARSHRSTCERSIKGGPETLEFACQEVGRTFGVMVGAKLTHNRKGKDFEINLIAWPDLTEGKWIPLPMFSFVHKI